MNKRDMIVIRLDRVYLYTHIINAEGFPPFCAVNL